VHQGTHGSNGCYDVVGETGYGNGTDTVYEESDPTAFYDADHLIYTAGPNVWDFVNVWEEHDDGYPTLRNVGAPVLEVDETPAPAMTWKRRVVINNL